MPSCVFLSSLSTLSITGQLCLTGTALDQLLPAVKKITKASLKWKSCNFAEQMYIYIQWFFFKTGLVAFFLLLAYETRAAAFQAVKSNFTFLCPACGRETSWPSSRGNALCPPLVSLSTTCWELKSWPQPMISRDLTGEAVNPSVHLTLNLARLLHECDFCSFFFLNRHLLLLSTQEIGVEISPWQESWQPRGSG